MKSQFEIIEVQKNIYLVREPYFFEHANIYIIKGTAFDLLVDCGVGLFDLKKFLEQRGFNIKVLLTHSHFDHAGGLKYFSPEQILVTSHILSNLRRKETWGLGFLRPEDFVIEMRPVAVNFCLNFRTKVDEKIVALSESRISVGGFNFEIFSCPGHTNDSIVLYDKVSKILITGDTLYNGKIYTGFVNSSNTQFKHSLERLARLPVKLVLPGHNSIMDGRKASEVIERWIGILGSAPFES